MTPDANLEEAKAGQKNACSVVTVVTVNMGKMSVREARHSFSAVCDQANAGQPVTITKNGKPWVMVVPIPQEPIKRDFSQLPPVTGKVDLDAFNAPMSEEEMGEESDSIPYSLLDTCALLALATQVSNKRLQPATLERLSTAPDVTISTISMYEMGLKWQKGLLALDHDPGVLWQHAIETWEIREVPITGEHAKQAALLPMHHRDPFDRLIMWLMSDTATIVVTCDQVFTSYGVPTIW